MLIFISVYTINVLVLTVDKASGMRPICLDLGLGFVEPSWRDGLEIEVYLFKIRF